MNRSHYECYKHRAWLGIKGFIHPVYEPKGHMIFGSWGF